MSAWLIYIWTRLDPILTAVIIGTIASGMVGSLCSIGYSVERSTYSGETDDAKLFKQIVKKCFPVFVVCLLLWVFVPSKKDAAMIYVIPKMAQSETFNTISKETPEITKLALEALKETLQGMTKENKQ